MNRRTPTLRTALLVVSILSLVTAFALSYFRPDLFQMSNALPATICYFGLFALLISRGPRGTTKPIDFESTKSSWWHGISGEFGIFIFLTVLSASIGAISGVAWWGAGGSEIRTILEAIWVGGIIGALTVVFMFAGG